MMCSRCVTQDGAGCQAIVDDSPSTWVSTGQFEGYVDLYPLQVAADDSLPFVYRADGSVVSRYGVQVLVTLEGEVRGS